MGTRNKTLIINDGETLVNQYGQWDGYPTTSTSEIVKVLKNNTIEAIKESLTKIEYVGDEYISKMLNDIPECYVLAKRGNIFDEISSRCVDIKAERYYQYDTVELIDTLMKEFDNQAVADYLTLTRDTGYDILKVLLILTKYDVVPHIYLDDYNGFDIEAVNVINLDDKTLLCNWHGNERKWNFDKLPTQEELEKFEQEDDE